MNVLRIKIVVLKENVLISKEPLYPNGSATVILDILDQIAVKVSFIFLMNCFNCIKAIKNITYVFKKKIESSIKSTKLDLSLYKTKQLSPDYRIHWRILKDQKEIEIVMIVNGTSWVGLGWRPRQLTAACRNFPLIQDLNKNVTQSKLQSAASSVSPHPTSEPEPSAEVSAEPSPKLSASEENKTPHPVSEPEPETTTEPPPPSTRPGLSSLRPRPRLVPIKTKRLANSENKNNERVTVSSSVSYQTQAISHREKRATHGNV